MLNKQLSIIKDKGKQTLDASFCHSITDSDLFHWDMNLLHVLGWSSLISCPDTVSIDHEIGSFGIYLWSSYAATEHAVDSSRKVESCSPLSGECRAAEELESCLLIGRSIAGGVRKSLAVDEKGTQTHTWRRIERQQLDRRRTEISQISQPHITSSCYTTNTESSSWHRL